MKALETSYAGHRFRSRLEARWAVFFDALGIEWQYEPEGFDIDGTPYLPDFHLTELGTWVEVKGDEADFERKASLYANAIDYGGHLPDVANSLGTTRGLLILGAIPRSGAGFPVHPLLQHHEGVVCSWAGFTTTGSLFIDGDQGDGEAACAPDLPRIRGTWTGCHYSDRPNMLLPRKTRIAYDRARRARFEFGESG